MRIGFIGIGKMGKPMCRNILKAGHSLVVANRSQAAVEELASEGASVAHSPAELTVQSEIIITCVTNPASVGEVYEGNDGIVSAIQPGQIAVDHTTVGPGTSQRIHSAVTAKGAGFIDAPVSGGTAGAESGTLTIMCGGEEAVFDKAKPALQSTGGNIYLAGPSGSGAVIKLVNQLLVGIHVAAAAEAVVMGAKAGADPNVILEIIGNSFGGSAMLKRSIPMALGRNFKAGTPVSLILRDLGTIGQMCSDVGARLTLGKVAESLFNEAHIAGLSENDMASIFKVFEESAGIEVGR